MESLFTYFRLNYLLYVKIIFEGKILEVYVFNIKLILSIE